jgi:hypothetical protein
MDRRLETAVAAEDDTANCQILQAHGAYTNVDVTQRLKELAPDRRFRMGNDSRWTRFNQIKTLRVYARSRDGMTAPWLNRWSVVVGAVHGWGGKLTRGLYGGVGHRPPGPTTRAIARAMAAAI